MRLRKVFPSPRWGVHPPDRKRPAADLPLRVLPLPERLFVPLQQHIGTPARPIVRAGQRVLKGQLLAEPQGTLSAAIHAPSSGQVLTIGEVTAPHPSALPIPAIVIACDGEERWIESDVPSDPFDLTPEEINRRIAAAGIVGLGGATFPAALKLGLGYRAGIHTLLINGSECEPYLSCDDRLMRDKPEAILDGVRLMLQATGARQALIGIESNKPEAIAAMEQAAQPYPELRVRILPARYPMGSERHLFAKLTGTELPADCRTTDLGVLVHNVATAYAVHQALRLGHPLVERILTLNGGAIANPGNVRVPIGTLVETLLEMDELNETPARLIMGGPMMGQSLPHARVPVVKGTSGLLALTAAETAFGTPRPCIRCASCARACPMNLLPMEMAARIGADDLDGAVELGLKDCLACGCCAYVCPAHLPLVQSFNHAKGALAARERARLRTESARRLAAARAERLEREARERAEAAARRKTERALRATKDPTPTITDPSAPERQAEVV